MFVKKSEKSYFYHLIYIYYFTRQNTVCFEPYKLTLSALNLKEIECSANPIFDFPLVKLTCTDLIRLSRILLSVVNVSCKTPKTLVDKLN